jgi:hypothetical protein
MSVEICTNDPSGKEDCFVYYVAYYVPNESRDSSFGIATRLWTGRSGF